MVTFNIEVLFKCSKVLHRLYHGKNSQKVLIPCKVNLMNIMLYTNLFTNARIKFCKKLTSYPCQAIISIWHFFLFRTQDFEKRIFSWIFWNILTVSDHWKNSLPGVKFRYACCYTGVHANINLKNPWAVASRLQT